MTLAELIDKLNAVRMSTGGDAEVYIQEEGEDELAANRLRTEIRTDNDEAYVTIFSSQ